jgi:hypothetical protein
MMQNFSYLVAHDSKLTEQQNFNKRKGAGDCWAIGQHDGYPIRTTMEVDW